MTRVMATVIVILAACTEATGQIIGGIDVTLSISEEEVAVGDTVEIRVAATNSTAGEVSFKG